MAMSKAHYSRFEKNMKHIHKGGLHRALGIPEDQKIPASRLREALHSKNAHVRKMAQLAKAFKGMKHK